MNAAIAKSKTDTDILERLTALLGEDVFFVPCEWGTKKPLVTYVERPFEATKTAPYRALFQVQEVNVAVYMGKASGRTRGNDAIGDRSVGGC